MSDYKQYHELEPYKRKSLTATNYWLLVFGREPIAVPAEDTGYWKYWNENQLETKAKEAYKRRQLNGKTEPTGDNGSAPAPAPRVQKTTQAQKTKPQGEKGVGGYGGLFS